MEYERTWNCGNCFNDQIPFHIGVCTCGYIRESGEMCDGFPSECYECDMLQICELFEDKLDRMSPEDRKFILATMEKSLI